MLIFIKKMTLLKVAIGTLFCLSDAMFTPELVKLVTTSNEKSMQSKL